MADRDRCLHLKRAPAARYGRARSTFLLASPVWPRIQREPLALPGQLDLPSGLIPEGFLDLNASRERWQSMFLLRTEKRSQRPG
jgi:hypothetical protein